jgi:hypothetical protein
VRALAFGLLLTVAACSSNALKPDGGSPGDAGDAHVTGDDKAPTGGTCERTNDRATITVDLPDGGELSCASPSSDAGVSTKDPQTWVGKVTAADATSLVVDVTGSPLRVEAHAPGLDLSGFPKVWVTVRAKVGRFFACQQSLEILAATPLDGSTAAAPPGQLLLAVADGGGPFPDSPYAVERTRLSCPGTDAGFQCGAGAGTYAFDFNTAGSTTLPVRVYMGETKTWAAVSGSYTVRNLRSYETGNCDDYWNWAYFISLNP